jgi:hypothetical protein
VLIPPLPSSSGDPAGNAAWLASAEPEALRAAVVRLRSRVDRLELENAALGYAAWSFGALADRLNSALRAAQGRSLVQQPRD